MSDRNLLFGILALQLGFVARGSLIAAMKAWTLDKSQSIGRIFQEQGALAGDAFNLLDALVLKYLAVHGEDLGRSIAAISSMDEAILRELKEIEDGDVQASLARAGNAPTVDLVAPTPASTAVGASSSRGSRFRIIRPHAKGGLGLVYVARDEELHRDVALKEIQDRHADHVESRSRFMLKAEITGGLEHPGIVPVYGLGQYADGRPFYAMRFIRGDSLKDAIAKFHADARPWHEKSLELRELLERLIDVCNAIQYAHDRGVLHRDLKPGNIMLGKYGETLVVDWGLAKPLGAAADPKAPSLSEEGMLLPASASGSAATMQGSAVGTPQYMSPEQAAGQHDQLGAASDVYSLGATLYSLLTGRAPFESQDAQARMDIPAVLQRVQAGDFPPPRQHNAAISRPLEAICLKAMARVSTERYDNPRALIDDIKHWLADEPVSAWPEPWTVQARRWMARHRTLVTGTAAALIVGVVSLTVATVLLADANEVIRGKNQALVDANLKIQEESEEREKQRVIAVSAQKKAEERLDQSVATLKLFANDARAYCEDAIVPGESKRKLFEVLAAQLDALAASEEEKEFNEDKLRARIFLHETVALVQIELARSVDADKSLGKALKLADRWLKEKPGDPGGLGRRAAVVHLTGVTQSRLLNFKTARKHYEEALAIRQQLLGNDKVERFTPGKTRMDLADSLDALDRFDEAIDLRVQALDIVREHLADGKPADLHFALDALNWTYQKAATKAGDYQKKKLYMDKADATSAELEKLRPTGRLVLDRWYKSARSYADMEQHQGELAILAKNDAKAKVHFAEAERQRNKQVEIARKLTTSKDLLDHRRAFAGAWYQLGRLEKKLGQAKSADQHFQYCLSLREELLRDYPRDVNLVHLRLDRLFALVAMGRYTETTNDAEMMNIKFGDKITTFRLACYYSLCVDAVRDARSPEPLNAKDKALQASFRDKALDCLERAVQSGFDDWEELETNADLEAVRAEVRFKKLLERAKK